ncbi:AAA family ATPase [Thermoactinomyces sp. CICC 23799]|uniref:AAA family ATPase n=1 Tax=Thermoactinomyces TaxID=2023 RepID=UPI0018DE030F|nr:AAA family ATPase [Thermoactinomyces sp. CICC 23799]MBH8600108.1 AAA family ATPase [Thermoactinomyces sp. CICC 23799]
MEMRIALTGKAGAGKDSIADLLVENCGFERLAFADALKEFDRQIFGESKVKNRRRLQELGQLCRKFDEEVWIKHLDKKLEQAGEKVVITDLRQMNEYEFCKRKGFVIVKVHADDDVRLERLKARGDNFQPEDLRHETELAVDDIPYDQLIDNNGDYEALVVQVMMLINSYANKLNPWRLP